MKLTLLLLCLFVFVGDVYMKRSYSRTSNGLHTSLQIRRTPFILPPITYPLRYPRPPIRLTRRPPTRPPPRRRSRRPLDTKPDEYRYLATIIAEEKHCAGILITENFVLAPSHCVFGSSKVSVCVGCRRGPKFYNFKHTNTSAQIFNATEMLFHPRFDVTENCLYVNDIALVKLPRPAIFNNRVYPGKLISKEETYLFNKTFVSSIGWSISSGTKSIQVERLWLLNQEDCANILLSEFLQNQQRCARGPSTLRLNLVGNTIKIEEKIVGFLGKRVSCSKESYVCLKLYVFVNLVPYLDWISEKVNVSLSELTGEKRNPQSDLIHVPKDDKEFHLNNSLPLNLGNFSNLFSNMSAITTEATKQEQILDVTFSTF